MVGTYQQLVLVSEISGSSTKGVSVVRPNGHTGDTIVDSVGLCEVMWDLGLGGNHEFEEVAEGIG